MADLPTRDGVVCVFVWSFCPHRHRTRGQSKAPLQSDLLRYKTEYLVFTSTIAPPIARSLMTSYDTVRFGLFRMPEVIN